MKKVLMVAGIFVGILVVPFLGMTISPTRELIMGLAPDEAVLQLADRIDENRAYTEQANLENNVKISELQAVIDNQETKLVDYQNRIEIQNAEILKIKADNQQTQTQVSKQFECEKLYGEEPLCQSDNRYRTRAKFSNMLDELEISKDEKERRTKIFNRCQEIIAKCG